MQIQLLLAAVCAILGMLADAYDAPGRTGNVLVFQMLMLSVVFLIVLQWARDKHKPAVFDPDPGERATDKVARFLYDALFLSLKTVHSIL